MWDGYFYFAAVGGGAALFLLLVALLFRRVFGPKLTKEPNAASRLLEAGHTFGVFLIMASIVRGCVKGEVLVDDLTWAATFGSIAVLLLELAGGVGVRFLIGAHLPAEVERGNVAAGLAAGGHYASTGIIAASCIYGESLVGLEISLLFFVIGQLSLHLLVMLFRVLTSYNDDEEIMGENLAAALSYTGVTVALGIIIGNAADGAFTTITASLLGYGLALLYGLFFYPIRQSLVMGLILRVKPTLRGGVLDKAIATSRDAGMAALEAATYLGAAILIAALA